MWCLRKGTRTAVCWQRLHPLGLELRIDVNGDTLRTTVGKTVEGAREQSAYMVGDAKKGGLYRCGATRAGS